MKVAVHINHAAHQAEHGNAVAEGLGRHGLEVVFAAYNDPVPADVAVIWGWRQPRVVQALKRSGGHALVMERGYLPDRMTWCSMGWDGLNGRAKHADCQDSGERFGRNWGHLLESWRTATGDYALLCGQVPTDTACVGMNFYGWAQQVADDLKAEGHRVLFRPHPVCVERGQQRGVTGADLSEVPTLTEDLRRAKLCITWNSNAAVESVLAAVPTVAMDEGSMAWAVTSHSLNEPLWWWRDRGAWCRRLAWSQYTIEEIRSGFFWDVLHGAMPTDRLGG